MNVLHSSMKITDEFYSNLNDGEVQERIGGLGRNSEQNNLDVQNIDALIILLQSLKANASKKNGGLKGTSRRRQAKFT